jgi:hypothetical protein
MVLFARDRSFSWARIAEFYNVDEAADSYVRAWLSRSDGLAKALGFSEVLAEDIECFLNGDISQEEWKQIKEGLDGEATVLETKLLSVEKAVETYGGLHHVPWISYEILGPKFAQVRGPHTLAVTVYPVITAAIWILANHCHSSRRWRRMY